MSGIFRHSPTPAVPPQLDPWLAETSATPLPDARAPATASLQRRYPKCRLNNMATKCDNAIDGIYEADPADWSYEFAEGLEETLATRRNTAQALAERIHGQGSAGKDQ